MYNPNSPYTQLGESSQSRGSPRSTPEITTRRLWTAEEDAALISAVGIYGSPGQGQSWSKISGVVGGGRTNKVSWLIQ
jgi:hypothetical protein